MQTPADHRLVPDRVYTTLASVLHAASLLICLIVVASFVMFATDQIGSASTAQANAIALPGQAASNAPVRHSSLRRRIDGLDSALTSPFRSLTGFSSQWGVQVSQTLLALLLYGLAVGYLVRFLRVREA